jgi:hypothetical protein
MSTLSQNRAAPPASPRLPPRFRLFQEARRWHRWLGLGCLLPTLLLGLTGILLNHKELFFGAANLRPAGLLTTTIKIEQLPFTFGDALARGREVWGDGVIEKVELKEEKGRLVYKIVAGPGRELLLDAQTGAMQTVDGLRIKQPGKDGTKLDWKKITGELHSGKIIGLTGRLLMDIAAAVLVVLAGTGLYLWALPRWQKSQQKPKTT